MTVEATVPERLAVEDKLPLILDDPTFLEENGFKVFAPSGTEWREVDPAENARAADVRFDGFEFEESGHGRTTEE